MARKNMQALQKDAAARNVVWLTHQLHRARAPSDHLAPAALADKLVKDWGAAPTAVLMDESGARWAAPMRRAPRRTCT